MRIRQIEEESRKLLLLCDSPMLDSYELKKLKEIMNSLQAFRSDFEKYHDIVNYMWTKDLFRYETIIKINSFKDKISQMKMLLKDHFAKTIEIVDFYQHSYQKNHSVTKEKYHKNKGHLKIEKEYLKQLLSKLQKITNKFKLSSEFFEKNCIIKSMRVSLSYSIDINFKPTDNFLIQLISEFNLVQKELKSLNDESSQTSTTQKLKFLRIMNTFLEEISSDELFILLKQYNFFSNKLLKYFSDILYLFSGANDIILVGKNEVYKEEDKIIQSCECHSTEATPTPVQHHMFGIKKKITKEISSSGTNKNEKASISSFTLNLEHDEQPLQNPLANSSFLKRSLVVNKDTEYKENSFSSSFIGLKSKPMSSRASLISRKIESNRLNSSHLINSNIMKFKDHNSGCNPCTLI